MMRLFKKLIARTLLRLFRVRYGNLLYVWFPVEGRFIVMTVSFVKQSTFSAKFVLDADADAVDLERNYGQSNNDVVIDRRTREPVDMRSK